MENNKEEKLLEEIKKYKSTHANNLLSRWKNKKESEKEALLLVMEKYISYRNSLDGLTSDDLDFSQMVEHLNIYKDFLRDYKEKNKLKFSAQTKFEPTILEEFLVIIFSKNKFCEKLQKGGIEAYSHLYFSPHSFAEFVNGPANLGIHVKEQDFTIYKEYKLEIDRKKETLKVPIISIECKTYLDKTMLEGSVATAEKVKRGNPQAKFYILTETYDVDYDVDVYGTQIDQIYVLRKQKRRNRGKINPIYADVIEDLWKTVEKFFNQESWSDNQKFIEKFGKIFNR